MSRTGLWYANNELVTGAYKSTYNWGGPHCTYKWNNTSENNIKPCSTFATNNLYDFRMFTDMCFLVSVSVAIQYQTSLHFFGGLTPVFGQLP